MEVEKDKSLPYLDARIIRDGHHLKTTVYRKPTDTARYWSLSSHHPLSAKRSVVHALLSRALTLVSDEADKKEEILPVKRMLLANDYPMAFINKELERLKDCTQRNVTEAEGKKFTTIAIPFIDKTTQAIHRILRPLGIRVVGRPHQWK